VLEVTNAGPAIPADHVQRLLQPFQRLGTDRVGSGNGHGLGLSIVAAIARAHDAALRVQPGPVGGLDVEVTFPPAPAA
jgi:signal transduction histidine kinase